MTFCPWRIHSGSQGGWEGHTDGAGTRRGSGTAEETGLPDQWVEARTQEGSHCDQRLYGYTADPHATNIYGEIFPYPIQSVAQESNPPGLLESMVRRASRFGEILEINLGNDYLATIGTKTRQPTGIPVS